MVYIILRREEVEILVSGVICERLASPAAVIPAKAGIHFATLQEWAVHVLDSRFRGNDRGLGRDAIPNDTTIETLDRRLIFQARRQGKTVREAL
jgi:hypothetical protein